MVSDHCHFVHRETDRLTSVLTTEKMNGSQGQCQIDGMTLRYCFSFTNKNNKKMLKFSNFQNKGTFFILFHKNKTASLLYDIAYTHTHNLYSTMTCQQHLVLKTHSVLQ